MTKDEQNLGKSPEVVLPVTTLPPERGSRRLDAKLLYVLVAVGALTGGLIADLLTGGYFINIFKGLPKEEFDGMYPMGTTIGMARPLVIGAGMSVGGLGLGAVYSKICWGSWFSRKRLSRS